jgi:hypothetical protein
VLENAKLELLDHLVAEIAVVDQIGAIVHCNRKWNEAAIIGLLPAKLTGWNYIKECEAAVQRGCTDWLARSPTGGAALLCCKLFLSI